MRRFLKWLKMFFSRFGNVLIALLKEVFNYSTATVIESIKDTIQSMVLEIANDPSLVTDEDKRRELLRRAKHRFEAEGKQVRDSIILLTAELIIRALKNKSKL